MDFEKNESNNSYCHLKGSAGGTCANIVLRVMATMVKMRFLYDYIMLL